MDPNKTVPRHVPADVDRGSRERVDPGGTHTRVWRLAPEDLASNAGAAAATPAPAQEGAKSGTRRAAQQSNADTREHAAAVVIAQTVMAAEKPRERQTAKTQLWTSGSINSAIEAAKRGGQAIPDARTPAQVWADQASAGAKTLVTSTPTPAPRPILQPLPPASGSPALSAAPTAQLRRDESRIWIPRQFWVPTPRVRRALPLALGIAAAGVLVFASTGLFGRQPATPNQVPKAAAAPQAPAIAGAVPRGASEPRPNREARRQAQAAAEPGATGDQHGVPHAAQPARAAGAPPSVSTASSSGVTARAAVDALIAGKRKLALQRYEALAQSAPEQPAYAAMVRILSDAERQTRLR